MVLKIKEVGRRKFSPIQKWMQMKKVMKQMNKMTLKGHNLENGKVNATFVRKGVT